MGRCPASCERSPRGAVVRPGRQRAPVRRRRVASTRSWRAANHRCATGAPGARAFVSRSRSSHPVCTRAAAEFNGPADRTLRRESQRAQKPPNRGQAQGHTIFPPNQVPDHRPRPEGKLELQLRTVQRGHYYIGRTALNKRSTPKSSSAYESEAARIYSMECFLSAL